MCGKVRVGVRVGNRIRVRIRIRVRVRVRVRVTALKLIPEPLEVQQLSNPHDDTHHAPCHLHSLASPNTILEPSQPRASPHRSLHTQEL